MSKNANSEKYSCENCPVDNARLCDEHYSCVRGVWEAALKEADNIGQKVTSTNSASEPCLCKTCLSFKQCVEGHVSAFIGMGNNTKREHLPEDILSNGDHFRK
jgi:hypothetical protein